MKKGIASVSQILKEARQSQGLSLEDVAQQTYIKLPYLIALEDEQYDKLPAPVYTYGYIRQYAKLLKLDGAELVSQYQAQQERNKPGKLLPKLNRSNGEPVEAAPSPTPAAATPAVDTAPPDSVAAPEGRPAPVPVPAPVAPGDSDEARRELESRGAQVRQQAQQIIETAHQEARQLRAGAERYAEQVLGQLEQEIQRVLVTIKNGRSYLHSRQLRRRHPET